MPGRLLARDFPCTSAAGHWKCLCMKGKPSTELRNAERRRVVGVRGVVNKPRPEDAFLLAFA